MDLCSDPIFIRHRDSSPPHPRLPPSLENASAGSHLPRFPLLQPPRLPLLYRPRICLLQPPRLPLLPPAAPPPPPTCSCTEDAIPKAPCSRGSVEPRSGDRPLVTGEEEHGRGEEAERAEEGPSFSLPNKQQRGCGYTDVEGRHRRRNAIHVLLGLAQGGRCIAAEYHGN